MNVLIVTFCSFVDNMYIALAIPEVVVLQKMLGKHVLIHLSWPIPSSHLLRIAC